jgi:hypothetical protein
MVAVAEALVAPRMTSVAVAEVTPQAGKLSCRTWRRFVPPWTRGETDEATSPGGSQHCEEENCGCTKKMQQVGAGDGVKGTGIYLGN